MCTGDSMKGMKTELECIQGFMNMAVIADSQAPDRLIVALVLYQNYQHGHVQYDMRD